MAVWSEVKISEIGPHFRIDSEYYQPYFLNMLDILRKKKAIPLGSYYARIRKERFTAKRGSSFDYIEISRVSTTLGTYKTIKIYDEVAPSRAQYLVRPGDVLVSEVRPNRSAIALISDGINRTVCSSGFAVVTPINVSSEFLFAYFKSSFITDLLARNTTATMYPAVSDDDILNLPFIKPSETLEKTITYEVDKAFSILEQSKELYGYAERLFLSELGLGELDLSPTLYYERSFSETQKADRLDTEFFDQKYQRVLKALESTKPKRVSKLGEFLTLLTNGHTPRYHDLSQGDITFLTAEHIFDFRIDYDSEKRILRKHHDGELKRTRLRQGDCLITIKGRIGNAAIAENFSGPVNINQDVALFRLKDSLPPYYLMAYLNSQAGKALTSQYCTGQINPFLGLSNIRLLPIPIYDDRQMQRIAAKLEETILKARDCRDQSRRLMNKAKENVEEAVLGGVL